MAAAPLSKTASVRDSPNYVPYLAWNDALADGVYPLLEEVGPAYLTLDEDQRNVVAAALEFDPADFDRELAGCLKGFLEFGSAGASALFERVNSELSIWRWLKKSQRGAPPVLPVLCLLAVAAARMASSEGMAETNFYGRVLEVLDIADPKGHFEQGYRRYGEDYWAALERWLEDNDGLRGLPTAVAIGFRFVGLPISQVLVREGDRAKLATFFMHAGFPPGAVVPPPELEPALDQWIRSDPCPVSQALAHHWQVPSTRTQILDVASAALATWDGHIKAHLTDGSSHRVSLALNVGTFPKKRVEFSPIAYLLEAGEARSGQIWTSSGWNEVDLTPFAPGIVRIGQPQALDNKSLLEGVIQVRDPFTAGQVERHPRRLMVFRRAELAGAFLEAEQIMLGEDVFIVARSEPRLMARIQEILGACARPGWESLPESFGGIPEGWTILRNVQMFRSPGDLIPEGQLDLRALAPLTNNQLIVAGGFSLPGSVRGKWHRDALPEARAVSDDPAGFELRLLDFGDDGADDDTPHLLQTWSSTKPGALIANLADLDLADGNYRVELKPHGSASAVSSITIRVRSGDHLDEKQREKVDPADQFLDDPLSVLSASVVVGDRTIAGATLYGDFDPATVSSSPIEAGTHWVTARSARHKVAVGIETVPQDSCLYTGKHRIDIATVQHDAQGRPLEPYVVGTCQRCGLVRRFPSSHWRAKKRTDRRYNKQSSKPTGSVQLEAVHEAAESPAWDIVLDAIFHCGAGTMHEFERIAMFAESSALVVDHLTRTLFAMGHIDLLRDPETLALESWDIAPAALVPTQHGWFLAGHWSRSLVSDQRRADHRVRLRKAINREAPTSYYFDQLPERLVPGVQVAGPALDIAVQLPPLSQVVEALPRIPATPRAGGLTAFDPISAKWQDAEGMGHVGGYRIRQFATDDVLRTQADLDGRTMAISTVQLSKHATALLWGRKPLLAYDASSKTLKVPLGANLPGLYERVVVLGSGLAPCPYGGSLEYRCVPAELAGHISYLLSH